VSAIRWGGEFAAVLAYSAFLATSAGFWAMTSISRALPAITTSLASLAIPAVGIAASALTLGETLSASLVGGLLLIALGVAGVALADARQRSRAAR
jgi:drug/metabolite transporter (DMT)-like permease